MLTATYLVAFLGLVAFLFLLARLGGAFWATTSFRGRARARSTGESRPKRGLVYYDSSAEADLVRVEEHAA
ncbi:hypothetical protein GCM10022221_09820 [Actinocorallia aurea]